MDINYTAVLVAALINMVLGYVWYARKVFGGAWMEDLGKKSMDLKNPSQGYALMIVASLVIAYVLAKFVGYADAVGFSAGAGIGLWAGLGLVATTQAANWIYEGHPSRLYFINAGYPVVSMALMAGVIAAMR